MDTGLLHLHRTVVILFIVFYLFKVVLLLANKEQLLDKIRSKYKIVDIVLGVIILITGGYLLATAGHPPTYLMVKTGLTLILIPLGIVGMRKGNKAISLIVLLGFFYVYGVSSTRSATLTKPSYTATNEGGEEIVKAELLYTNECARCHGNNGQAMKFGSKNLAMSELSDEEKYSIIKNGKGSMAAYDHLSDQEINTLVNYINAFKVEK